MSTRTTVTLDDDVIRRVKSESKSRGASFRQTLNDLLRLALLQEQPRNRSLTIRPTHMGYRPELNYDDIESLIELGEGERRR